MIFCGFFPRLTKIWFCNKLQLLRQSYQLIVDQCSIYIFTLYVSYPWTLLSKIIQRNKSFSSEVQFHSTIFFYISDTFKSTLNFSLCSCIQTGCYILNLIKISSSDTLPLSRGAAYQDGCFQSNFSILT